MNTPQQIQDLVAEIVHAYPAAQLELDPLPSGVCFLWVTIADRNFVLEYSPRQGTGVSENLPNTPPFGGHEHGFASLDEAVNFFKQMLAQAAREVFSTAASRT
ncbi:MAG TPA: hypothetical protein VEL06_05365 [Haliangiales bacterium]|nr:hypothetical protein [Haliangiales bacterium]